ncbi:unnamed protein product [Clonostachys solani]|uniref:non-specific serine/threonine protein kinase n=1 Tax=Clonostachys solani TaxID=160281 RepID=A0A9N9W4Z0_9HYPO|nr:unnamed protein product [Clonostachys solani]
MPSVLKWARSALRRAPSLPLRFPSTGFEIVPASELLEEEHLEEFSAGAYYPVNIGDVYHSKYQIVGKLGFGSTSTVWLAKSLQEHFYVALKVHILGYTGKEEFEVCKKILQGDSAHPGYHHLRTAREMIVLPHSNGDHHCLVQDPMWDSWRDILRRNPTRRFNLPMLKGGLQQILRALDYLHNEYIKANNILHKIVDKSILDSFVEEECTPHRPGKL